LKENCAAVIFRRADKYIIQAVLVKITYSKAGPSVESMCGTSGSQLKSTN
jgi:hypothetical protein